MTLRDTEVVVLAADGFEEMEFWYPVLRCREAGANVTVLGVGGGDVRVGRCGYPVVPDATVDAYTGQPKIAVVPGVAGPPPTDLRTSVSSRLQDWAAGGARLVATSSGVDVLAAAGLLDGRTVSCAPSAESAVRDSGGTVSDAAVSVSGPVATARTVDDVASLFAKLSDDWDLIAAG